MKTRVRAGATLGKYSDLARGSPLGPAGVELGCDARAEMGTPRTRHWEKWALTKRAVLGFLTLGDEVRPSLGSWKHWEVTLGPGQVPSLVLGDELGMS
jgi:hypothetical protein